MKRMLLILGGVILVVAVLAACKGDDEIVEEAKGGPHVVTPAVSPVSGDTQTEPEGPIDGGVIDSTDPDAPKTIEDTRIIDFSCRFSTLDDAEPGMLGNHIYYLTAKLENGAVKGSYEVRDTDEKRDFRASHSFMNDLDELVKRYDIPQFNGHSVEVKGLPGDYGAGLTARYASKEAVYAEDNEANFLPYNFLNELLRLFERGAAVTPTVVDLTVNTHYESKEAGGGYGQVSCPVYALGYLNAWGDRVPPDGYGKLEDAIISISDDLLSGVDDAFDRFGTAPQGKVLYCETQGFVTRSDSEVVAFYERTRRYEDEGQEHEYTEIKTHNLNARTGKELKFSDVFRDMEYLPHLLLMEFERAYPELTFYDDALDFIRQSIEGNDGNISFALSYGFVHIFADEYVLCDKAGELHITLSYVLNPDLLRAFYATAPWKYLLPLDDGTTYWRTDTSHSFRVKSTFGGLYQEDVIWEVMLDGKDEGAYVEPFNGEAPDCWLVRVNGRYFLYLRVPTGDVSMLTQVYEVSETGVSKKTFEPIPLALRSDTPLDPDWMKWSLNELVMDGPVQMLPTGWYKAEVDGLPEFVGGVYDVDGPWVALKEGGRYNPDSRDNAAVSGGMWTLVAGQSMRPYQTDMETFLDFITDDGRVVRFTIDKWDDEMRLDNFGTLADVFTADNG